MVTRLTVKLVTVWWGHSEVFWRTTSRHIKHLHCFSLNSIQSSRFDTADCSCTGSLKHVTTIFGHVVALFLFWIPLSRVFRVLLRCYLRVLLEWCECYWCDVQVLRSFTYCVPKFYVFFKVLRLKVNWSLDFWTILIVSNYLQLYEYWIELTGSNLSQESV